MAIRFSILVCSVSTRRATFLPKIIEQIYGQIEREGLNTEVECIVLMDNKTMTVGDKRNRLIEASRGHWVCFVDDDDRIADDYVRTLYSASRKTDADTITFYASVSINGQVSKIARFDCSENKNLSNSYERQPNHLMLIKRTIAHLIGFKSISFQEDDDYAARCYPLIKKIYNIDKVLYYYDFNEKTTETQKK